MLIKSFVLGAALVSTPLCFFDLQGPERNGAATPAAASTEATQGESAAQLQRTQQMLAAARRELQSAQRDLADLRRQVNELLDIADAGLLARRRDGSQSCSPTRNRALLSHYQWLDRNHHAERAEKALAAVVELAGSDVGRLAEMARELMTEKETAGQYDRLALALAQRVEQAANGRRLDARQLDAMALAHFLNGGIDRAIALQEAAIEAGGRGDDYRRQLRTYQAARAALVAAQGGEAAAPAIAAAHDDE